MADLHLPAGLAGSAALREATAEELRVLIALIQAGEVLSPETVAEAVGISRARAVAALAYFRASGVLPEGGIVDEHPFFLEGGRLDELSPARMANAVERENLKPLLEECAALLGKPTLSATESRDVVALYEQYGLNEEYITTLLADICRLPNPTVRGMVNRAISLHGKDIRTPEALNAHLADRDRSNDAIHIYRRVMGFYDRNLSAAEKQSAARWVGELGFDEQVLSFAYDYAVDRGVSNVRAYMDKLLTVFHDGGCRSRAECETYLQTHPAPAARAAGNKKKPLEEKLYTDSFDPEDAFQKALARSYGEDKKGD